MPAIDPTARLIRNLLTLQRIGTALTLLAQPLLDELFQQIVADLVRIDPTGPSAERWRRYRTDTFVGKVAERLAAVYPGWEKAVRAELARVGRAQALEAHEVLVVSLGERSGRATPTPITQARVRTIMNSRPFEGAILREHAEALEAATLRRIRRQVRTGMSLEESIPEIVKRVRGVSEHTRRDAEAVVRTAVNFVSNQGALETYRANGRLLKGLRYSATLDRRTTVLCASLDGTLYDVDDTSIPVPPNHYNCRSTLVPEVDYEAVGLPPPPEGERVAKDASGKNVDVPSSTIYEEWLRDQPISVQEEVLGVGKAKLFREGRISLRDLIRRDLTVIPLSDLLGEAA